MTKETKQQIMAEYATHEGDTGSPEVQSAVLTTRSNERNAHLKDDIERYRSLIKRLGIRK